MSLDPESLPLLQHALESPSAFTPERLMDAVRVERGLAHEPVPPLCVLDFDGDLSDRLTDDGAAAPMKSWACFHTSLSVITLNGLRCGIVPRTIGGPYAVLVAEQLWAGGAHVIVGITSAGRISPTLPLPAVVIIDQAVRDEGTSLHYVPPAITIDTATPAIVDVLVQELSTVAADVRRGPAWTTDAPYRETADQLGRGLTGRAGGRDAGRVALRVRAARAANVAMVAPSVTASRRQRSVRYRRTVPPWRSGGRGARGAVVHRVGSCGTTRRPFGRLRTEEHPWRAAATSDTVDQQFTNKKAAKELERYRRKGVEPTTRLLLDGISQAGVTDVTLLEVGAGVGALTFELLERGFNRAVIVEASAAYTAAASNEAARRGRSKDVHFVSGDFLEVAGTVPAASVVALDRVVCCYPLYEELLNEAVRHAEQGFAFSYRRSWASSRNEGGECTQATQ